MRFKLLGSIRRLGDKIKNHAGVVMLVAVCAFLSCWAFSEGDTDVGFILAGFALLVILFKIFKKIWAEKFGNVPLWIIMKSRNRFGKSKFAEMLVREFEATNWSCFEGNGVSIYEDRICTKTKTYKYSDYGLTNIDLIDCKLLAVYIGNRLPKNTYYSVSSIKSESVSDGHYFIYETPGGHIEMSGGGDYREDVIGYSVYFKPPKRPKTNITPIGKK